MKSITAQELSTLLHYNSNVQLIDVREPEEHETFNIGGELIPLGDIVHQITKIATDKPVVIYCHHGIRSQIAIQRLMEKYPFTNLMNLIGGTAAWEKQFPV
jgi:adenylyltransferase/sulfurtransferase